MKTFLYGASGHAKVIIEILENRAIEVVGLFDDNPRIKKVLDYPCFGQIDQQMIGANSLIISIGDNQIRKKIAELYPDLHYGLALDSSANISKRSEIASGTVVMKGVSINSSVNIGKHCVINTNSSVDHDCMIGDYVHISPNSAIAGNVKIGEGTHIGTGVSIIPNLNIGKWCVIGAGAVVVKDIPDFSVVVGNPARIIKKNEI